MPLECKCRKTIFIPNPKFGMEFCNDVKFLHRNSIFICTFMSQLRNCDSEDLGDMT
jgi:hypothetical protein